MAEKMMWTKEQQQVIELRNRSLLVSAAAGSGKTAVLVQRIIEKICDENNPVDIDRLLVVTFTNAAAGEMKERVREAISKRLEEDPKNEYLRRQEILAGHAHITTIDSFCLSVLREHFQEIQLDPGFRIADEGELKLLRADVLEALLENEYREASEAFVNFMEAYSAGKDDERAAQMIYQLYNFAMANPRPEDWLAHCLEGYEANNIEQLQRQPWMCAMLENVKNVLDELSLYYGQMIKLCRDEGDMESYESILEAEMQMTMKAAKAEGYEAMRETVNLIRFVSKPRKKKTDTFSEEKAKRIWDMREQAKKQIKSIAENYFNDSPEYIIQKQHVAAAQIKELVRLTHEFWERYSAAKRKKNLVDFSDVEHLALDILSKKTDDKEVPTAVARQYSECFEEIMIDEYQDSNYVQELILTSISRNDPPNIFMVGDVKQSIYRFRLARPELFMEKYAAYTREDSEKQKIELHQNFRSRKSVLDSVNFFFFQIMHRSVGNVEYDAEAALYPSIEYAPCDEYKTGGDTELLLLDLEDCAEEESEDETEPVVEQADTEAAYSSREWEAALIADKIKELTDPEKGMYVWDKEIKKYRLAEYRDIAILLRTVSGWSEEFIPVLLSKGIPAVADSTSGYFSAIEVQTVLNLLEIIDNPRQDIPLAAILHSSIAGFSSEELAVIKTATDMSSKCFYDAVKAYVNVQDEKERVLKRKVKKFIDKLEIYREKSRYMQLRELISYVLEDSGYYEFVCAMPQAQQRKANLDMLLERAGAFDKTSYQGLFQFVRYINRLKKYSVDYAAAQNCTQNQVHIMSIHKSKGLEFPICFVAGMGKHFNKQDLNAAMLFSVDYGIGTDAIDLANRTKETTIMKEAIRHQLALENLGEELRVLYVAMTRAKEKLYLVGAKEGLLEYLGKIIEETDKSSQSLSYHMITQANCFLDWITAAMCKHSCFVQIYKKLGLNVPFDGICFKDESPLSVSIVTKSSLSMNEALRRSEDALKRNALEQWDTKAHDEESRKFIENRFGISYEGGWLARLQAAFTVSELKRENDEYESDYTKIEMLNVEKVNSTENLDTKESEQEEILMPKFLQEEQKPKGAARGTLYHKLFELLDFSQDIRLQLEQLLKCEKISREELKSIYVYDFEKFAASRLGRKIIEAQKDGRYHKEMPFILGIPAIEMIQKLAEHEADSKEEIQALVSEGKLNKNDSLEYVSVQGVIDGWIDEDDGIILLDFKTDRRPSGMDEQEFELILKKRYHIQLEYYKRALEQMTKKKVKESCIYSVAMGKEIFC